VQPGAPSGPEGVLIGLTRPPSAWMSARTPGGRAKAASRVDSGNRKPAKKKASHHHKLQRAKSKLNLDGLKETTPTTKLADAVVAATAKKDAIKVAIRCRPLIGRDAGQRRSYATEANSLKVAAAADADAGGENDQAWSFDNVFDEATSARDIHDSLTSDVVSSVMDGFHGTIFAYGQTGSGARSLSPVAVVVAVVVFVPDKHACSSLPPSPPPPPLSLCVCVRVRARVCVCMWGGGRQNVHHGGLPC
jgi:hypothetical protein